MSETLQYTIVSIILLAILVLLIRRARKALCQRKKKSGIKPRCAGCLASKSCHKPGASRCDIY